MTTDEQWASALRAHARTVYPAGTGPDPGVVVHAGRRRRRARRAAGVTAACVVVLALVVAVPAAIDQVNRHQPTYPIGTPTTTVPTSTVSRAPLHQDAHTVGTSQVASLGGMQAVNRPDYDMGQLVADGVAGLTVTVVATSDDAVTLTVDGRDLGAGVASQPLGWHINDDPSDYGSTDPYPASTPVLSGTSATSDFGYLAGVVPAWLHDPRALLVSRTGWTLPDGTTTHVAELPTFYGPTADGRLLFLLAATGSDAQTLLSDARPSVAFVGAAGDEPFVPGCEGLTTDECGTTLGIPLTTWLHQTPAQF